MSMTIGNNGGPSCEMNVTPLIDVLLVLIIIFMIIIPVQQVGLKALVPEQPKVEPTTPDPIGTVIVQVTGAGNTSTLKINNEDVSYDNLEARLIEIFKTRNQRVMFVQADTEVDFAQIARVLDSAHGAGIYDIGLMTTKAGNRG